MIHTSGITGSKKWGGRLLPLAGLIAAAGIGIFGYSQCDSNENGNPTRRRSADVTSTLTPLPVSAPPPRLTIQSSSSRPIPIESEKAEEESSQKKHFRSLRNEAGINDFQFEDVELVAPPEGAPNDPESTRKCKEIKIEGQTVGYINTWVPEPIIARIQEGKVLDTLAEVFPLSQPNIYFEIVDSVIDLPVGKYSTLWGSQRNTCIENIVWNDGWEEFFVKDFSIKDFPTRVKLGKDQGLLYPANRNGFRISPKPTWQFEYKSGDGLNLSTREEIFLLADPGIGLLLGSHEDGDRFFIRLQDSCSPDAQMLPKFLEINIDNFPSSVESVYGREDH